MSSIDWLFIELVIHCTGRTDEMAEEWRTELNDRLQKRSIEALLRRSSRSPRKETMDSSPLGELGWKWLPVKQNFKKSRGTNSNFVIVKVIMGSSLTRFFVKDCSSSWQTHHSQVFHSHPEEGGFMKVICGIYLQRIFYRYTGIALPP